MNIALIHFRVGETDGVSLEMDKWKNALESLGHNVFYFAGNTYDSSTYVIEELAFDNPTDLLLADECYDKLINFNETSLENKIKAVAKSIKEQLIHLINQLKIDIIVPNNLFALARSIPIALGLYEAICATGIKAVNHHHDFYWERIRYANPTSAFVKNSLEKLFPPRDQVMKHVVINSLAKRDLKIRKGLNSTIVPNVFDFSQPIWEKDDYNCDFKSAFGLDDRHVIFLQATRVVNRKAIELSIDVIAKMNQQKERYLHRKLYDGRIFDTNSEFVLLCVGMHEGTNRYEEKLKSYAEKLNVKLIMDPTKIHHTRKMIHGNKIYSLWDAYVDSDIISYPSIYEGFGNQFLEGLFAKKPMIIFEYSVFQADIMSKGFEYASLGNQASEDAMGLVHAEASVIDACITSIDQYLFDSEIRKHVIDKNFELGKKYYSQETLKNLLKEIFQ
jgi:hypothetical protein